MVKNKWKRIMAVSLVAAMTLTGCSTGDKGSAVSAPAESQKGQSGEQFLTTYGDKQFEDTKLTVMVYDRNSAPNGVTATNNRWTEYINQEMNKVGISVEFVAVPRSDDEQKVQTMMAAGTAPDIVMSYNSTMVEDYYKRGGTFDLSPYVDGEDQVKNLKAYVGEDVIDMGRNKEGALWGIPAKRSITSRTNMFIRKDWLDKLEMEVPTTTDELYTVLKAFKENNPDGREDVIPFASFNIRGLYQDVLSMAFMKIVDTEENFNIHEPYPVYSDDGFVEYMRFLNKLYNEGLMDPEYYAAGDGGQVRNEQFVNGQLGFYVYNVNGSVDSMRGSLLQNLKANYPDADVISIPPLKNVYDGKQYNDGYQKKGAYVFIPQTCKNPEAAVTYLDWLATKEGGFTLFHGFEEEHYIEEDSIPIVKDAAYNAVDKDWIRHDLFLIGNQGYYVSEEDFIKASSKEIPGYEQYVTDNYNNGIMGEVRRESGYISPLQVEKASDLGLVGDEYNVESITCSPEEFDQNIANYRAALDDCGMEEILKEREAHFSK